MSEKKQAIRLDFLINASYSIKPVIHTFILELRLQFKKFLLFLSLTFVFLFLMSFINFFFNQLPHSLLLYYEILTDYLFMIIIFAVSVLFGGIICSEYKSKTGLVVLPLINKNKLILGKYLANAILVSGIICVFYLSLTLFAYYFYGGPILNTILFSFGLAILYTLALASIAVFLSSFLPSIIPVIIIMVGYILTWDSYLSQFFAVSTGELEPLYSFSYLFEIVKQIFYPNFSTMARYNEYQGWLFPSIEGALILLSFYMILFFILSILLFKHRQF